MSIIPSMPDYTDKDFDSINRRIEQLIRAKFTRWTSFNRVDFGNFLKEMFAFVMDVLTFYQDQQARESRWGTATRRQNIIELAKLIAYELAGASAATVDVIVTISRSVPAPNDGDVTFPAGTVVKTLDTIDPKRFEFTSDFVIPSGSNSGSATVQHSESEQDIGTTTGEASEEITLTQRPYLDDSVVLVIGVDTWTQVDNFLDSTATDNHFTLAVDASDYATIRLGDGTNGARAAAGAAYVATYKIGGGADGNVEADTIAAFEQQTGWADEFGAPISIVSVTHAAAASGGSDRMSVAEARERAPASLRVLNRCVARTDFEDIAIQVAGVARALMLSANEAGIPEGTGRLYIVPDGGGTPSAALKTAVEDFINTDYPPPLTLSWGVWDPVYQTINIVAYVYPAANATEAGIEQDALEALRAYFSPLNADGTINSAIDFGYNYKKPGAAPGDPPEADPIVALSTIGDLIKDLASVRRLGTPTDAEGITLNGAEDDVELELWEFPMGGTLTLYNGDTSTIFAGHPVAI